MNIAIKDKRETYAKFRNHVMFVKSVVYIVGVQKRFHDMYDFGFKPKISSFNHTMSSL